MDKTNYIAID